MNTLPPFSHSIEVPACSSEEEDAPAGCEAGAWDRPLSLRAAEDAARRAAAGPEWFARLRRAGGGRF